MKKIFLGCVLLLTTLNLSICGEQIEAEEIYTWKSVEFEDLPTIEKSLLGDYPYYIPENNNIVDIGYHVASGVMLVVIVRARPGVPVALGAFCAKEYESGSSPKIWGFPNYEVNTLPDKSFSAAPLEDDKKGELLTFGEQGLPYGHNLPIYYEPSPAIGSQELDKLVTLYYVTIDDKCNRVFFVDIGVVNYYRNTTYYVQNPALVAIDLPTNGCDSRDFPTNRRAEFPPNIAARGNDGYGSVVLDYQASGECDDLFLYIPNAFYDFLLVYDYKNDKFWNVNHETFHPVLPESFFIFDKTFPFQAPFGIYPITLGQSDENGDRKFYYAPMASLNLFSVPTNILKDSTKSPDKYGEDDFKLVGQKESHHQSTSVVIDHNTGVMFFGGTESNQILCWNTKKPFKPENIEVIYESENLLVAYDVKIDAENNLWFISNHIPVIFFSDNALDLNEINTRVFRVKVADAIKGTVCE
ncbi:L-dopachrome tautomerase yellow-f2-like [Lutzomyia longipalpis]|uniref:L-dopachrome tautomerase yellow-f2-like n=1 Tax=Lutzomyia longipalpis TaxID=7200 RepID=UPI002483C1D9|nr:L-dopachrome tautomerase yellow-f2-like [Lutzomyia longipalpis]